MQADYWRNQAAQLSKEVNRLNDELATRNPSRTTGDMPSADNPTMEVEATFYTAYCPTGCIGITKTGIDVSNTIYTPDGYRIIAVDPEQIPLGSHVKVTLENGKSFEAKAEDTGGLIKGERIDVLVDSRARAYELGRQTAEVEIISEG